MGASESIREIQKYIFETAPGARETGDRLPFFIFVRTMSEHISFDYRRDLKSGIYRCLSVDVTRPVDLLQEKVTVFKLCRGLPVCSRRATLLQASLADT